MFRLLRPFGSPKCAEVSRGNVPRLRLGANNSWCQTLLGAAFVGAMSLWKKSADYADFLSAFICAICGPLFP
ncbi:MAG: hypothetical protein LBG05_07450, partial [Treponema sp.]|nr:hypothetical protein [Treponema sp.]